MKYTNTNKARWSTPTAITTLLMITALFWQCSNAPATETANEAPVVAETVADVEAAPRKATPVNRTAVEEEEPAIDPADGIQWMNWDDAVASNEKTPKMLFIDVYTDWCGWCKVMDKQTFTDPQVIDYINKNYYAVKFNAENEDPVSFRGQEFKVVEGGRRGIHTLAYALLEGQLSYPSYVYLNSNFQRVNVSKGFKPAEPFLTEMKAITEGQTQ